MLTALPQQFAATATVSPLARHSPFVSQSSLRCRPLTGVLVTAPKVRMQNQARQTLKSPRLTVATAPSAPQCGQVRNSPTLISTAASEASLAGLSARTLPPPPINAVAEQHSALCSACRSLTSMPEMLPALYFPQIFQAIHRSLTR